MKSMPAIALCLLFLAASVVAAEGNGTAKKEEVKKPNPLTKLPSKPGAHVAKIKALKDNAWVNLGQAAPDKKWGKEGTARGRSWGGRSMTYAPDLGGAFFCGEGVHGMVKSNGHYGDDLWFYDAYAHRWICLYPGGNTKKIKLKLDKHGFEINEEGEHVPVAYLGHAFGRMTYDTHRRKLVISYAHHPWWTRAYPQRWGWLDQKYPSVKKKYYGGVGSIIPQPKHPLFWDVKNGKWERRLSTGPGPETYKHNAAEMGLTQYIPSKKKVLFSTTGTLLMYYDYEKNSWTQSRAANAMGARTPNGCYDSKRDRVYALSGKRFAYLDFKANKWTAAKTEGGPKKIGDSNSGRLTYDAASGKLIWHPTDRTKGNIYAYDPETDSWEKPERTMPDLGDAYAHYLMVHGFYHEKLNVHYYYLAADSSLKGYMLAYRYKRKPKTEG